MSQLGERNPMDGGATSASNAPTAAQESRFKPITDLWAGGQSPQASTFVKECLSCDRWAGITVILGGCYFLWNTRKAPSIATKWVMAAAGSVMVAGGAYQGFIHNYFKVQIDGLVFFPSKDPLQA